MRILLRCLCGAALCAGVAVFLHAQDAEAERVKGTVLLLKNGHAMIGEVEKVGTQTRVRNGSSEVWIANDKAARLCADWDDAYRFVQTLIKPDADEHVRLARWCQLHRLNDKALEQAQKALTLKPAHSEARQLIAMLERAKQDADRPVAKPKASKTPEPTAVSVDVVSATLIGFTTHVQPILMNACANCHASGQGGKFVLERVAEGGPKPGTMRNLAAVLDYIDLDHPNISPLLKRSIEAHGGEQRAAFHGRDAAAFQRMQLWVMQTIERNPQLRDYRAVKGKPTSPMKTEKPVPIEPTRVTPVTQPTALRETTIAPQKKVAPAMQQHQASLVTAIEPQTKATPVEAQPAAKQRIVLEDDPFDPTPFNRHFHAQRLEQAANAAK